jgi:shikimate dehydrogenase
VLLPVIERLGSLREARCAVIGAGGAAKATLWSLRNAEAAVSLFARDELKGRGLAELFGAGYQRLDGANFDGFDVVINTTPLGMTGPTVNQTAAVSSQLRGARLAYDLVYNPTDTLFLKEARAAGCETVRGLSMLVLQAAEQFKLWTGKDAPVEVMREASRR